MLPTQQGLDAVQGARRQLDLRLEVDDEVLVLDRLAQVSGELQAPAGRPVGLLGVHLDRLDSVLLGRENRGVGLLHQARLVTGVIGEAGDADRRTDAQVQPVDHHGFGDGGARGVGEGDGLVGGGGLQQDGELVAADTAEGDVRRREAAEAIGDRPQQPVAGGVAEGLVHVAEAVEIDEDDRARHRVALAHGTAEQLRELATVHESGKRVVRREPLAGGGLRAQFLDQSAVLQRHCRLVGERREHGDVLGAEGGDVAHPAPSRQRADDDAVHDDRRDHGIDASACALGARRPARRHDPRETEVVAPRAIERHELAVVEPDPQVGAAGTGAEQEKIGRLRPQPRHRLADDRVDRAELLGCARQLARELVEPFEATVAVDEAGVGAVRHIQHAGGHDEEERGVPAGGEQPGGSETERRVRQLAQQRERQEPPQFETVTGIGGPHRRVHEQERGERARDDGDERRSPGPRHARARRRSTGDAKHRDHHDDLEVVQRSVECQLLPPGPQVGGERHDAADDARDDELVRREHEQAQHQYHVAEREGYGVVAKFDVDLGPLADGEQRGHDEPRQRPHRRPARRAHIAEV